MRPPVALAALALLLGACRGKGGPGRGPGGGEDSSPGSDTAAPAGPGCGDGRVQVGEDCDDGAANSDTAPDACRSDCTAARCGDAVVDAGEGCDDGGRWGGDGCTPACGVDPASPESEPNDLPAEAAPLAALQGGALPAGDADCFAVSLADCDALRVVEQAPCAGLSLSLVAPDATVRAIGGPGPDGCAALDPAEQPGDRDLPAGTYHLCVGAPVATDIPTYTLAAEVGPSASLGAPAGSSPDADADGAADTCDTDRDGDGVPNAEDTCPDLSNGPGSAPLALSSGGFVTAWLGAGPFTGTSTTGGCRPSDDALVGEDAPGFAPVLGDAAGSATWVALLQGTDRLELLTPYGAVAAPREAYAFAHIWSPGARSLTLAVGADDGVFAWWNDARVLDIAGCQGTNIDQFTATVSVLAGWNRLLLKVRDQGGGWGLYARFKDPVSGAIIADLTPGLVPIEGATLPQTDADGDGLGDVCDPSP